MTFHDYKLVTNYPENPALTALSKTPRLMALSFQAEAVLAKIRDVHTLTLLHSWADHLGCHLDPGEDLTEADYLEGLHVLAPFIRATAHSPITRA